MYKLIGCVLILVACTGMGLGKGKDLENHLNALEELKKCFLLLRSEVMYTRAPFAELFQKISGKVARPYGSWLTNMSERLTQKGAGTFWELWQASIEEELKDSSLTEHDKEELVHVGKNLEYTESLDLYIEQLEYTITHTREAYRSKQKLYRSMGIMGGIFLVILLL